jgi:pyroglutamyl-peptidase
VGDPAVSFVVTGFEPFEGRRRNRSWEVVSRLGAHAQVQVVQLPVSFGRLGESIAELADRPLVGLLMLGESRAARICVEQVALNIADSDRPDNAGAKPRTEPLVPDGPLALRATWNARAVAQRLNENRIPAAASFHAGTYACNAALYLALHGLAARVPVGFLHVPRGRWPLGMRMGQLLRAVDVCRELLIEPGRRE